MADEFAAVVADLVSTGEAVTYTPDGGSAVPISALVVLLGAAAPSWLAEGYDWDAAEWAEVTVVAGDLAAAPARNDTVVDEAGTTWTVQARQPIGPGSSPGGWLLACSCEEGVRVG